MNIENYVRYIKYEEIWWDLEGIQKFYIQDYRNKEIEIVIILVI